MNHPTMFLTMLVKVHQLLCDFSMPETDSMFFGLLFLSPRFSSLASFCCLLISLIHYFPLPFTSEGEVWLINPPKDGSCFSSFPPSPPLLASSVMRMKEGREEEKGGNHKNNIFPSKIFHSFSLSSSQPSSPTPSSSSFIPHTTLGVNGACIHHFLFLLFYVSLSLS